MGLSGPIEARDGWTGVCGTLSRGTRLVSMPSCSFGSSSGFIIITVHMQQHTHSLGCGSPVEPAVVGSICIVAGMPYIAQLQPVKRAGGSAVSSRDGYRTVDM